MPIYGWALTRSPAEGDMSNIGAYHFTKLSDKVLELFVEYRS